MSFKNLGLTGEIIKNIETQGYTQPTPIQKHAIPVIIKGRDILAGAQTGTGKTAAFTLPLLHRLGQSPRKSRLARALILVPTRELASQVGASLQTYGKSLPLRSTTIYGGVGINPQIQRLRQGVDIIIGTPGRLLDLSERRALNLSEIEVLVLDEADRMMDMGFIHDIRKIVALVPQKRQTLFFSATYSKQVKSLSHTILNRPELVEVARQNTAAQTVDHCIYRTPQSSKAELLRHLIVTGNWNQVLVFTKTKHGANKLSKQIAKAGISTTAIHGNKSQAARTRALADFKNYKVQVLVATDIAARGLDIDQLPHVVNYELPHVAEDYIHRIGRTGRAGCAGNAVSLVSRDETYLLRGIERLLKKTIPVKKADGFDHSESVDTTANFRPRRPRGPKKHKNAPRSGKNNRIRL